MSQYQKAIGQKFHEFSTFILERDFSIADDPDTGSIFLKGWIIFIDHSVLEFAEKYSLHGHRYRFHYMDHKKRLILRWDNVPHHRDTSTFPHHKHTPRGVESSQDIALTNVLDHIVANLLSEQ